MSQGALRIVTALIGAPLVLVATIFGGLYFTVLVLFAVAACQVEFYQLAGATEHKVPAALAVMAGASAVVGFVYPMGFGIALALVLILLLSFPFIYAGQQTIPVLTSLLAGVLYPALMLGTLVGIRSSSSEIALHLTVLSVVLVWSSDTFAYYTGKSIGKHQLTPISPKKTWEGAIGGVIGAGLIGTVLKLYWVGPALDWKSLVVLVIVCGAIGQAGDIFESKLKRAAGVKDSGSLLPGHGGMLDRMDAVIVVAPLVYLYFVYWPSNPF